MTVDKVIEKIDSIQLIMEYIEADMIEIHRIHHDGARIDNNILDDVYEYLGQYKCLLESLEVRGLPSELS